MFLQSVLIPGVNVSVGAVCSFSHFGWSCGRGVEEGTILPVCLQNDDVLLKQPEVIARLEGSCCSTNRYESAHPIITR